MLDYQQAAIAAVRQSAMQKIHKYLLYVEQVCQPFNVNASVLTNVVLSSPITINFHPDRLSGNGKTVLTNILSQGQYLSQFRTGTTNGGTGIHIGGNRFAWEQELFQGAYPPDLLDRPKYGALNFFRYTDGASARFGSCFFTLKNEIKDRCTFAYGDSSTNPTTLCTADTFIAIVAAMFEDVEQNRRLLNQVITSQQEALAIMLMNKACNIGRNLDYCIETHVHGNVSMDDVASFHVDESFWRTEIEEQAKELCEKHDIALNWIPKRQVAVSDIGGIFRGPQIPILARKIDRIFGNGSGVINALLIGEGSCSSINEYKQWKELGTDVELFTYFKQLWHTVAFFG